MSDFNELKHEIMEMANDDKLDVRSRMQNVESVICPIIERYIKDYGVGCRLGGVAKWWDIDAPEGFGSYQGRTVLLIKYARNGRITIGHLLSIFDKQYTENLPIKNVIIVIIGDLGGKAKEVLTKRIEQAEGEIHFDIWFYDYVVDIVSRHENLYAELLSENKNVLIGLSDNGVSKGRMLNDDNATLIEEIRSSIQRHGATLFLGAGVSMDSGIPNWRGLINELFVDIVNMTLDDFGVILSEKSKKIVIEELEKEKTLHC